MKTKDRASEEVNERHPETLCWLQVAAILTLAVVCQPEPGLAWGDRGHKLVNAAAVDNLPQPLRSYFEARKVYLVEHASDPDHLAHDDAAERPHHYTDMDADDTYPFPNLRRQFVLERAAPMFWQLRNGDSLWQIERFTLRLADSLEHRRWQAADQDAVYAAHYAADLTQPLHTVKNYDGQLTGQKGVHARFETDLVNALADGWRLEAQPAVFLPDLRGRIFEEAVRSFNCRNLVFASDRIAVSGRTYLDPQYNAVFYKLAAPLALKQLSDAASFVSSLWYTAWVRAGKPPLPSKIVEAREASELGVEAALRRQMAR
jgi:S1/P1 nuclease